MSTLSRRRFQQGMAAASASLLITGTRASGNIAGANDRLRIAIAGVNGRGNSHMSGWLEQDNVEIAYLVDPDETVLAKGLKRLSEKSDGKSRATGVADIRKVLEDKTVDAISVACPNHWHSLMTIWGAQAGKHVYVEKPMSHDVEEGRVWWKRKRGMESSSSTEHNFEAVPRWQDFTKRFKKASWKTEDLLRILLQGTRIDRA